MGKTQGAKELSCEKKKTFMWYPIVSWQQNFQKYNCFPCFPIRLHATTLKKYGVNVYEFI